MSRYRIKSQIECFNNNEERKIYWIVGTWIWKFSVKDTIRAKRHLIQIDKQNRKRGK